MIGRRQKAMKSYQCAECSGLIAKGEEYVRDDPPPRERERRGVGKRILCAPCWGRERPLHWP